MKNLRAKIEKAVTRKEISSRGGGVEISLDTFGFKGEKMSSYQNYLGGGMLGAIQANDTIRCHSFFSITDKQDAKLDAISEELKQYFHGLTNPDEEEWESVSYEQNQNMPASTY